MASVSGSPHTDSAQGLLGPAQQMRWRVPELALVLSDRAVALARRTGDQAARLRAEALAVFASNRLGRGVPATGRALAAVRDAESAGDAEVAAELRVELAWCARSAGSNEIAARILSPVLERERIEPEVRAHGLLALAAALPAHRQDGERSEALDEAERLYEVCELGPDTTRLLKARVCAARAGHHRRLGEFGDAIVAADAGLALLQQLGDPDADSGEMHTRLVLERVQSLLELGRGPDAAEATESVLARPVRAAAAGPVCWLGLALATRVHLPDGNEWAAVRVLNDTAAISERHKLDGLLAETLNALSQVHERGADFTEALRTLRGAYAADRRWRGAVHNARLRLLAEFPALTGEVEVARRSSGSAEPAPPEPGPSEPEPSGPQAAEPQRPAPGPSEPEPSKPQVAQSRRRSEYEEAHDAARRLMETLTSRSAELRDGGQRKKAVPEAETSTADPFGSATAESPVESWPRGGRSAVEPVDAPVGRATAIESADQDAPTRGATANEDAEPSAPRADWWPSESWDQPSRAERTIPEVAVPAETESSEPRRVEPRSGADALAAAAERLRRSTTSADPDSGSDVTAIMPVVETPNALDSILAAWSGSRAEADRQPARAATEQPVGEPPESYPPAAEPARDSSENGPAEDPAGGLDQPEGGRRSRGRSLAEIRASLQLAAEPRRGRRRARHAESEETAAAAPTPAAEVLARHREDWATEPNLPVPEPEPAAPVPEVREPAVDQPVEPPAADASLPPEKIGLAELLTEALMAYETGRRGQAEAEEIAPSGRHSDRRVPGATGHSRVSRTRYSSTSDEWDSGAAARHRRSGIDSAAADPLF
ncbi:hypothetical protein MOQ72_02125 [Saccharopolyspora sp. K220]|uniref:hypothetical protein n=1 Tax=Saccharopolyspora soli TaxID=2926618 RepID=UPI001F55CF27|nr:hypothetical protein [Saccharopolyspora soli]MCI2416207.1 hypothetical protein [Saccharopolyspora soli]